MAPNRGQRRGIVEAAKDLNGSFWYAHEDEYKVEINRQGKKIIDCSSLDVSSGLRY